MCDKIAVLIPCYNEEKTVEKVIEDFRCELNNATIYVYNNNSTDNTYEIAKKAGAIVRNEYKQGKGNVVRRMLKEIEADIYVLVDGDDTYDAKDVHTLIDLVKNNKADMAVGDRISSGEYKMANTRHFHNFGNKLVINTINSIFKTKLKDIMSGYRVLNKDFAKNVAILSEGFEVETEMTLYALNMNYRVLEKPVSYRKRQAGSKSKLNTFPDGMKVMMTIFNAFKNYRPLKFFTILSSIFLIISLVIGLPLFFEYFKTGLVAKFPRGILATGIAICGILFLVSGIILDTLVKNQRQELEFLRKINLK